MTITREQVVSYLAELGDDEAVFEVTREAIDRIWESKPPDVEARGWEIVLVDVPATARVPVMAELRKDHPDWSLGEAHRFAQTERPAVKVEVWQGEDSAEDIAGRYRDAGAVVEVVCLDRHHPQTAPRVGYSAFPTGSVEGIES